MPSQTQDSSRSPSAVSRSNGIPASAFADSFVEKLRLLVRLQEESGGQEGSTAAEAALSGPLGVEEMATAGGPVFAVVRAREPVSEGGRAAALCKSRAQALRLAAVLPAAAALNPYHLSDGPKRLGIPLHEGRVHVGHVSGFGTGSTATARRHALLGHLHVARYLTSHPEALALLLEAVGPEALPILGRALAQRVEKELQNRGA